MLINNSNIKRAAKPLQLFLYKLIFPPTPLSPSSSPPRLSPPPLSDTHRKYIIIKLGKGRNTAVTELIKLAKSNESVLRSFV